jgi:hypothetical protein
VKGDGNRYRRWLRLYPRAYRTDRGEEILGTLVESSSDHHRLALGDLAYLVAHAARVRLRLIARRPAPAPLPQPARVVMWILIGLGIMDLFDGVVLDRGGPKNPGPDVRGIAAGLVFLVLAVFLAARRRSLYATVIGVLLLFVGSAVVETDQLIGALILASPLVVLLLLLLVGWRRYMAALAKDLPAGQPGRTPSG